MKNNGNKYLNEFLNEMRHDAIARQLSGMVAQDSDVALLGRAIFYVTSFAATARKYGFLAREEEAMNLDMEKPLEALFYEAIELIVDGCNSAWMLELLSNRYWMNAPEGYEAIAEYICIRGMIMVLEGENPRWVEQIAASMLPTAMREKCMEICKRYEEQKPKRQNEAAKAFFETDFSRSQEQIVRKALEELEQELIHMKDRPIQRLLREVDNNYLVPALVGMTAEARNAVARNMSFRLREMIMEDCYELSDIDSLAIAEGAVYIIEKLRVLQACGEITQEDYI